MRRSRTRLAAVAAAAVAEEAVGVVEGGGEGNAEVHKVAAGREVVAGHAGVVVVVAVEGGGEAVAGGRGEGGKGGIRARATVDLTEPRVRGGRARMGMMPSGRPREEAGGEEVEVGRALRRCCVGGGAAWWCCSGPPGTWRAFTGR